MGVAAQRAANRAMTGTWDNQRYVNVKPKYEIVITYATSLNQKFWDFERK